jgi:hypothetical protein
MAEMWIVNSTAPPTCRPTSVHRTCVTKKRKKEVVAGDWKNCTMRSFIICIYNVPDITGEIQIKEDEMVWGMCVAGRERREMHTGFW